MPHIFWSTRHGYIFVFLCLHAVCVCALDNDLCLIFLFKSRQRSKGLFVMRRNMAARTIFKIITTSCSFSHSICLRIGCLCVCMNLCVRGFSGSGFCRWWGSRRLQFVCSHYPLGLGCVCRGVSQVVSECLGRCDFPMTKHNNSRLGFSHKAIGIIHWFTNKAPRTPTQRWAWLRLYGGR